MTYSIESRELDSLISLQEVAKEPSLLSDTSLAPCIPTIDLKNLIMEKAQGSELEKLHLACKEWGIFQLLNHGLSMEKLKYELEEFYSLPIEEKMRYKLRPGEVEGYGQTSVHSQNQKNADWADRFFMITNPIQKRKPHLLPQLPLSLRETIEAYITELQKVAKVLLFSLAETLNIDSKDVEDTFEDGMQAVRATYYPPCPEPEKVMGFRPHSDASGITILYQANGVDGLQVKKNGVWIPVHFLPNAFVVNVGDILEVLPLTLPNAFSW